MNKPFDVPIEQLAHDLTLISVGKDIGQGATPHLLLKTYVARYEAIKRELIEELK